MFPIKYLAQAKLGLVQALNWKRQLTQNKSAKSTLSSYFLKKNMDPPEVREGDPLMLGKQLQNDQLGKWTPLGKVR